MYIYFLCVGCRPLASLLLGVIGRYSASGFLLVKEHHGYTGKFVTPPFSVLFKKHFLTTYSQSSSVLTRTQSLKTNGRIPVPKLLLATRTQAHEQTVAF